MPRPTDWPFGTWIGTLPSNSVFAGKRIRLVIDSVLSTVTGSVHGYYYKVNFSWDIDSSSPWTTSIQKLPTGPGQSYCWWVYDSTWNIETFLVDVINNNNHVKLSTTYLGQSGTKPTQIGMYLYEATVNGITETATGIIVTMSKQ